MTRFWNVPCSGSHDWKGWLLLWIPLKLTMPLVRAPLSCPDHFSKPYALTLSHRVSINESWGLHTFNPLYTASLNIDSVQCSVLSQLLLSLSPPHLPNAQILSIQMTLGLVPQGEFRLTSTFACLPLCTFFLGTLRSLFLQ